MKRRVIAGLYAVLLAGSGAIAAAEVKIGVVNIQRLAAESPLAKAANEAIQNEFTARAQELMEQDAALQARQEKLSKDAATMTEIQRSAADKELRDGARDLAARKAAFDDDLEARQQDENLKIGRSLQEAISAFALEQGYDLILAEGVIFATSSMDVTPAILQSLQARRAGNTPAAAQPAATPKP